ncbi:AMP-binding protein [Nonomuraea sp. NPDC049714]|uniref:AMP-binding protein n=1 Tax=Nonomuraea sp. NPDC049714 TaxID=3364357 RepID=UPI0037A7C8AE
MNATGAYRQSRDQLLRLRGDHARAVAEFRWPELGTRFNWAVDWFDAVASGNDRPALVVVEEDGSATERTFAEMSRASDRLSSWLAAGGVRKGDPVLLMLGNQVELWEAMLAIMKLGAVILPTTTAVGRADLADRIARGRVRHVICDAADTGTFGQVPGDYTRISVGAAEGWSDLREAADLEHTSVGHPGTTPDDPLLLYFTSGTTSRPKLVEHTQVSYPVGHLSTMYWLGLRPGDVHLNISSPGWAKHAWSCFFAPWIAEATIVVHDYRRFDAAALLDQLHRRKVSSFCAPPTVWRMLINAELGERPEALREAISAGEPLNPEVIERVRRAWGVTVRDGFGQTETTAQVGNTPGAGGYYHTGDVASRDAEGYITYIGRTDDVFKASDYKISPFELESALIEHPAVAEAAVVPAPDPVRLAVPKAYIALAPGHEPTEETALSILRYAREHLAPYQRVRRIEFFDLPKTISGKIRRVELRAREQELADGRRASAEWRDDQFPGLKG